MIILESLCTDARPIITIFLDNLNKGKVSVKPHVFSDITDQWRYSGIVILKINKFGVLPSIYFIWPYKK